MSSNKTVDNCFLRSECAEAREQGIKRLITVFTEAMSHVARKTSKVYLVKIFDTKVDGKVRARLALTSSTTMFQEIECRIIGS